MDPLQVQVVLEVLGRPAEHVQEALKLLVTKIESEPSTKVLEKTFHEPAPVKDSKDLFTSFVNLILEIDTLEQYLGFLFAYMPAHSEVISPEGIPLTNAQLNEICGTLVARLHNYDAVTKKLVVEREMILQEVKKHAPHLFRPAVSPSISPVSEPAVQAKKDKSKKKSSKKKK